MIWRMKSPASVVRAILTQMKTPQTSNDDIATTYVPTLSRFSDVAWTLYTDIAKTPQNTHLQYVGHDNVNGAFASTVIIYIIRRYTNPYGYPSAPFPGLEFGIDTPEGAALLGTPNGMGTGWLFYDRSKELGRRNLKVRIWTEGRMLLMAFNFVPV